MKDCAQKWLVMLASAAAVLLLNGADSTAPKNGSKPSPVQVQPSTKEPVKKPTVKKPAVPPDSQILVRVNGVDVTRGQLNRYMDMMVMLLKNRRKNTPPEVIAKFRRKKFAAFSNDLYRRALFSTCLAHSNITVTAEAKAAVENDCLKGFGRPKQTFAELKEAVGKAGFAKEFEENLNFDIRLRAFVTTVCSNRYFVTEDELKKVKDGLAAYNKRAEATNQLTIARAEQILKRAKDGEDFAKLADEFSEDENKKNGGDLGDCDESDFADEKHIWRAISKLNAGSVSDIFETEDGYAIYKVVRHNTPDKSLNGAETSTLSRIFFRRAYLFPKQTDEELRIDVEKEKRESLLGDLYKAFRAQSKISYPNGHIKAK